MEILFVTITAMAGFAILIGLRGSVKGPELRPVKARSRQRDPRR
jgi:hypothetical protein